MYDLRAAFLLACSALMAFGGCASNDVPKRSEFVDEELSDYRPLELLQLLKENAQTWRVFTVEEAVKGWVSEADVASLIPLLDSDQPCAPVIQSASGYLPPVSTVGRESAFMIQGFQQGIYPPEPSAPELSRKEKKKMVQWWNERNSAAK